jgi:hypothetical protein
MRQPVEPVSAMSDQPDGFNPYRVSRAIDPTGPMLTRSQQRVLWILTEQCPRPGMAVRSRAVAEEARKRLGAVMLVLRKLEDKGLAVASDLAGGAEGECLWMPTLAGRARVRAAAATTSAGSGGALEGILGARSHTARVRIRFTDETRRTWSGGTLPEPRLRDDHAFTGADVWPAGDPFVFADDVFAGVREERPPGEPVRPLDGPLPEAPGEGDQRAA